MSKLIIILVLTITSIQISFSSSSTTTETFSDNDAAILNTKRHNLIKLAFAELRKAIWQDSTFELAAEFMRDIKQWANTVDAANFKKSEFQTQIDVCLNLLNTLKADRGNCQVHANLLENYVQIRELTPDDDREFKNLQTAFTSKLRKVLQNQRDNLYSQLKNEMEIFIKDLNDAEKRHAHDLIEWNDKFNSEKDFHVKQHMALDFPRLFSKKQLDANTTCLPNSIISTIN